MFSEGSFTNVSLPLSPPEAQISNFNWTKSPAGQLSCKLIFAFSRLKPQTSNFNSQISSLTKLRNVKSQNSNLQS